MSDLEPRVTNLERINETNARTLQAVQRDVHHISETFRKMEQTFEKLIQVTYQLDAVRESSTRAHKRLDEIDVRMKQDNDRFHACRSTKLDKADLEAVHKRLDDVSADVSEIKIKAASSAWVEKVVWAVSSGVIVAALSYIKLEG